MKKIPQFFFFLIVIASQFFNTAEKINNSREDNVSTFKKAERILYAPEDKNPDIWIPIDLGTIIAIDFKSSTRINSEGFKWM